MSRRGAPLPPDEDRRLAALDELQVLDTGAEAVFDDVVLLASQLCGTPIALVSLIDAERQWFKARVGLDATETPRSDAFCAHAILDPDTVMQVHDAVLDPRFTDNPLVQGEPRIRFYAGAPIVTPAGDALGTVCVIDREPRELSAGQAAALQALARQTAVLLQLRAANRSKDRQAAALRQEVTDALTGADNDNALLRKRQRLAAVGQLTSGIAHDFNNLLQAVSGNLQLIERKADQPNVVRRRAQGGLDAVRSAADLTRQLLNFSRDQVPEYRPMAAAARVAQMRELLRRAVGPEMQLQFRLQDTEVLTLADPTQLEAAILNLAINARDAQHGVGALRIGSRRAPVRGDAELPDGAYLVLTLEDDGPGMAPDVAARAFEPFFTTKGEAQGTGLGLAQVRGFALRAGGTARITSAPGQGTTVTLWLREVDSAAAPPEGIGTPAPCDPTPARVNAHVLLVDDDGHVRESLGALLAEAGYRVTVAAAGAQALVAVAASAPDIVLADFGMVGMNGAALAGELRRLHPGLPVVILTGYADVDRLLPLLWPGAVVLRKPLLLDAVRGAIDDALGGGCAPAA
ncbi:MAG: response regulator [Proteobacteria bacterium]|nr:response regulator [Pseudomonadota bacterium]